MSKNKIIYKSDKWYEVIERILSRMYGKNKLSDIKLDEAFNKGMLKASQVTQIKSKNSMVKGN